MSDTIMDLKLASERPDGVIVRSLREYEQLYEYRSVFDDTPRRFALWGLPRRRGWVQIGSDSDATWCSIQRAKARFTNAARVLRGYNKAHASAYGLMLYRELARRPLTTRIVAPDTPLEGLRQMGRMLDRVYR